MKIGIVSDTHGCLDTWLNLYDKYLANSDLIIHAGDVLYHGPRNKIPAEYNPSGLAEILNQCPVPIIAAHGNCDAEVDSMVLNFPIQAPYSYLQFNELKILVAHGHNLDSKLRKSLAEKYKISLFITGHTHIPELNHCNGVIFLNPGSPSMSKLSNGKGTFGFIDGDVVRIIELDSGRTTTSMKSYTRPVRTVL